MSNQNMLTEQNIIAFNKSKIYEKLDYQPQPKEYSSKIPWVVQQQIAATNGIHYVDRIGKLKNYPIYQLPVPKVNGGIMLDIGNGWGRWLVAGANAGYIPVGIDIRLEFCQTARKVLSDLGKNGYSVVADLENLPFKDNIFDLVWSFSVIQHTHYKRLINCLGHVGRILNNEGITFLEFPNKKGVRNSYKYVKQLEGDRDNYNSWSVRYYTPKEYLEILDIYFDDTKYYNHSFIGIGILKEDLKYVSPKNKIVVMASRFGSFLTSVVPGLKNYSDSLYFEGHKNDNAKGAKNMSAIKAFMNKHQQDPSDNLNLQYLLRCPKYGGDITISPDGKRAMSVEAGIYYPIENNIPIMIASEGLSL